MSKKRDKIHPTQDSTALAVQNTNPLSASRPEPPQPKLFPSLTDRELVGLFALQGSNTTLPFGNASPKFNEKFAISAASSIAPRDGLEALLALQMVKTHNLGKRYLELTAAKNETAHGIELFSKSANLLLRTFTKQVEALKMYRSKGEQKVEVEHVHVHRGGQAVVGMVTTKGQDPGVGDVGNGEA